MGIIKKQEGSIAAIVLLILTILTLVGVASLNTSNTELITAGNDVAIKQNLYRAEAAAVEGAHWLENAASTVLSDLSSTAFLGQNDIDLTSLDLSDVRWQMSGVDPEQNGAAPITGYSIVDETGPVDLSAESNLYTYRIYGLYDRPDGINKGRVLIAIGYRKRF
jgi:competence protein ComGC